MMVSTKVSKENISPTRMIEEEINFEDWLSGLERLEDEIDMRLYKMRNPEENKMEDGEDYWILCTIGENTYSELFHIENGIAKGYSINFIIGEPGVKIHSSRKYYHETKSTSAPKNAA